MRAAIVHGDLESLAGWSLSRKTLADDENTNTLQKQIVTSRCRIIASSHTCLPVAVALETALGRCAVFNNGAAGMPNFRNVHCGVITRIATTPSVNPTLYGTCISGVYVDALPVNYDKLRWRNDFLRMWPQRSAAYESYHRRLTAGPDYCVTRAVQL